LGYAVLATPIATQIGDGARQDAYTTRRVCLALLVVTTPGWRSSGPIGSGSVASAAAKFTQRASIESQIHNAASKSKRLIDYTMASSEAGFPDRNSA